MSKIIIGIHGLSNKPPATVLYDEGWVEAMIEGVRHTSGIDNPSFDFEGVYWADRNYDRAARDSDPFREAIPGAIKSYDEGTIDSIVQRVETTGGKLLDWFKEKLSIEEAANKILEKKLHDLHLYYDKQTKFDELTGLLATVLKKHADKRIMLIGHSMGSIIAYDTLRILGRQNSTLSVDHFITIGSPLGLPHVVKKVCDIHGHPRTPTVVKRWTNFADRRDPVASDEHLADDYRSNTAGIRVEDDLVLNDWRVLSGSDIFHKSFGYLRTPEFSRALAEFI